MSPVFAPVTILQRIIMQRGITIGKVAAAMKVSERQVYYYIHHRYPVPLMQLTALCELLDVDPEDVVDSKRFLLSWSSGSVD